MLPVCTITTTLSPLLWPHASAVTPVFGWFSCGANKEVREATENMCTRLLYHFHPKCPALTFPLPVLLCPNLLCLFLLLSPLQKNLFTAERKTRIRHNQSHPGQVTIKWRMLRADPEFPGPLQQGPFRLPAQLLAGAIQGCAAGVRGTDPA